MADPRVAVVTGVGLDHTERLGSTVREIALDKSHVIRPGTAAVIGPGALAVADVFLARAENVGVSPIVVAGSTEVSPVPEGATVRFAVTRRPARPGGTVALDVRGLQDAYRDVALRAPSYQAANAAVATAAAEAFLGRALSADAMRPALAAMCFPGRFELVASSPPLVLDGAHNPQAAAVLASAIAEAWPDGDRRPVCVLGILKDKDAEGILRELAAVVARFVVTEPDSPRALHAEELAAITQAVTGAVPSVVPDPIAAVAHARGAAGGVGVVVTGSLYTVGQVRTGILL